MWDEKCHCSMQRLKKLKFSFLFRSTQMMCLHLHYWSMKILLEICTKAAIICLKKQNFELKEISKNPRKNTQNSRKNSQNSREKLNFWVMWKRCPKKTLDAFYTLSHPFVRFRRLYLLSYAFICFHKLLYDFICFHTLLYPFQHFQIHF